MKSEPLAPAIRRAPFRTLGGISEIHSRVNMAQQ